MTTTTVRPFTTKQEIYIVLRHCGAYGYTFIPKEYTATAKQIEKRGLGSIFKARGGLRLDFEREDMETIEEIVEKYRTMHRLGAKQKEMFRDLTHYVYRWTSGDSLRVARRLEALGLVTVDNEIGWQRTYITPLGRAVAAANGVHY